MASRPEGIGETTAASNPLTRSTGSPSRQTSFLPTRVNEGRLLTMLVASMFLVVTNINMMAPLLVDLAADFHTSVGSMGELAAAAAVPWALLAPFMGALSDRFGRRPLLATGIAILGLTTLLSALAWSYPSLLVIRVIGGIGGASTGPNIMSSAADYFPVNRRGRALGMVLAAVSLATVVGVPLLAMAAAHIGWRLSFAGLGLVLLGLGTTVYVTFPRVKPPAFRKGHLLDFTAALAEGSTRLLLLANGLERAAFTTAATYLAAFLMQSYSLRLDQIAPALSATAVGTLLGSTLGGRLADTGRRPGLVYAGFQIMAAATVLPMFATTPGVIPTALLAATFGLANSMARPAWMWVISQVPENRRGATMGFTATTNQVGLMIGASVGGILISTGGYSALGLQASCASLAAAGVCTLAIRRMAKTKAAPQEK